MCYFSSFWNVLPKSFQIFSADVADMFPNRLFDTKLLCKDELNWRLHSLEYCFKKAQRLNEANTAIGKPVITVNHQKFPLEYDNIVNIPVDIHRRVFGETRPKVGSDVCELLYNYGFCNAFKQNSCQHPVELHQMDLVLDLEENKDVWKRKDEEESALSWLEDLSLAGIQHMCFFRMNLPLPLALSLCTQIFSGNNLGSRPQKEQSLSCKDLEVLYLCLV